jgi:hypothetical protein
MDEDTFGFEIIDHEEVIEKVFTAMHEILEKNGYTIKKKENFGWEAYTQVKKNEQGADIGLFVHETYDDISVIEERAESYKELKKSNFLGLKEELRVILTNLMKKHGFPLHAYSVEPLDSPEELLISCAYFKPPASMYSIAIGDEDILSEAFE